MRRATTSNVLAIPAGHRYVERIRPPGWRYLPDPTIPWWPHRGLEPEHVRSVRDRIDLVHLHFGFEHRSAAEIEAWLDTLDDLDLPLVLTVHDLRNPHLVANDRHEHHLAMLVTRASVVLTLTPCAASEIERRWQRRAEVVAHPPLYDAGPIQTTETGLVGITFKDRPSSAGAELLAPICRAARRRGGRVRARFEPSADPAVVREARRLVGGCGDVVVERPPGDDAFADHLAGLQVAVLPYRFGTHSGWLEACRDLGTRVVAPALGCFGDQWDAVIEYDSGRERAASLEWAVDRSLALGTVRVPSATDQQDRLSAIKVAHDETYRSVLTGAHR